MKNSTGSDERLVPPLRNCAKADKGQRYQCVSEKRNVLLRRATLSNKKESTSEKHGAGSEHAP